MYSDNFLSSPAARCIKSTLSVSGNHNVKRSVFLSIPQTEKIPAPPIRRAGCEAPRPEKGEGDSRGEEERLCMSGGVNISGSALGIARAAYGHNVQRLCVIAVIVFLRRAAAVDTHNSVVNRFQFPGAYRAPNNLVGTRGNTCCRSLALRSAKVSGVSNGLFSADRTGFHLSSLAMGRLYGAHRKQLCAVRIANVWPLSERQRTHPCLRPTDILGNFGLGKPGRL